MAVRIIITDDHLISTQVVKSILESNPELKVIRICRSGKEALEAVDELQPDIILLDINMSPLNGFDTTKLLLEKHPHLKVIGFSVNNEPYYAQTILKNGGKGFITKTSPAAEIINGILEVNKGKQFICSEIQAKMKF